MKQHFLTLNPELNFLRNRKKAIFRKKEISLDRPYKKSRSLYASVLIFTTNQIFQFKSFIGHTKRKHSQRNLNSILLGVRNSLFIINFEHLKLSIRRACFFLGYVQLKACTAVVFNKNEIFENVIRFFAVKAGWVFSYNKFPGGTLTNQKQIFLAQYIKFRETLESVKNIRSTVPIVTVKTMPRMPEIVLLFQQEESYDMLNEIKCLRLPHLCLVDSDAKEIQIDYPLFGNDDSIENVYCYLSLLSSVLITLRLKKKEFFIFPEKKTKNILENRFLNC